MKVKLVLLDANVIIEAFRIGVWDKLIEKIEISIGRTIFDDEANHYFESDTGGKKYIDLNPYVLNGKLKVIDGNVQVISKIKNRCGKYLELHAGELESLSIIKHVSKDYYFCTADIAAIKALSILDLKGHAISFERLLNEKGIPRNKNVKLRIQYTELFFQKWLKEGSKLRVETEQIG